MKWIDVACDVVVNASIATVMVGALVNQSVPAALVAIGMVMWKRGKEG